MDEMKRRGYVRMSGPGASFAFTTDAMGMSSLNLYWLADVIRKYDAQGKRLSSPEPHDESQAFAELDILRPLVQEVDDERVDLCNRL